MRLGAMQAPPSSCSCMVDARCPLHRRAEELLRKALDLFAVYNSLTPEGLARGEDVPALRGMQAELHRITGQDPVRALEERRRRPAAVPWKVPVRDPGRSSGKRRALQLRGAYGRDWNRAADVRKAWREGQSFLVDGDHPAAGRLVDRDSVQVLAPSTIEVRYRQGEKKLRLSHKPKSRRPATRRRPRRS